MSEWRYNFDDIEFGARILVEDEFGRLLIVKAIEGEDLDNGLCSIEFFDEFGNHLDDIEITRWLPLAEILPAEQRQEAGK